MRLTTILFLAMLGFISCIKEKENRELDGKWKMTKYYDRNTNSFHTKPDTSADVFLVIDGSDFTAFAGPHLICDGDYLLIHDDISFSTDNMYVGIVTHDSWTDMFLWTIQACGLQSVYPCAPSKLEKLSSSQIRINTPLRMDIILTKVR